MDKICFSLLACLLLLVLSCADAPIDDNEVVINIPIDFTVDMWENLEGNARDNLDLIVKTTRVYDCTNFEIDTQLDEGEKTFVLTLEDIIEPSDCEPYPAAAQAWINLDELSIGNYTILINLKDAITNQGSLVVSDARFVLEMESPDGIELLREELNRVPENFIWGYVSYEGNNSLATVNNFIVALEQIAPTNLISDGYYGHFSINNTQLELEANPTYGNSLTFYNHFEQSEDLLTELINEYTSNDEDQKVEIKIFTSKGKEF